MTDLTFAPGRNCWRHARADRFSLIIDAQDYFVALRRAMIEARDQVLMIGWDFDFEIEMLPGQSDAGGLAPDGLPNRVGPFLEALVDRAPRLDIYLLKWSGGVLIAPARIIPGLRVKWLSPGQIHLGFDGRHPVGACHHQKIVVVDDSLAFCGGIDVTDGRWDTRAHRPGDPCRALKSGEIAQPWHDAAAMFDGPAVRVTADLARARWLRATDEDLPAPLADTRDMWPAEVEPDLRDVEIALSRTEPPTGDAPAVVEIETMYLDAIASARRSIYLESQYFSAPGIADAIAARLAEPDGPDVVVINPRAAQGAVEDLAMHVPRSRILREMARRDPHRRFRILYPVNAASEPIYVHAKLMIVDDTMLRVGSSNLNRRSMGFDSEADVTLIAANDEHRAAIRRIRASLLAEHMGRDTDRVARAIERRGLVGAVRALNHMTHRRLRRVPRRREGFWGRWLADMRIFDPRYHPDADGRSGVTGRHLMIGAGVLALGAGLIAWRRRTRGAARTRAESHTPPRDPGRDHDGR